MDVNKLLEGFLGSQGGLGDVAKQIKSQQSGLPSGLVGGAAAGGLIAVLLGSKKARKLGGKAIKYGGMAAVAGLAYKAYNDWQSNKTPGAPSGPASLPKPETGSAFDIEHDTDAKGPDFRLVVMQATIAAAQADNHIDRDEHARIRQQVENLGLGAEEKAALYEYFAQPADPATIAELATTDAQRAEVYLASALSIDPDTPEEQSYMANLARFLNLPQGLRDHLDAEADAARAQVV